jgi:phosphoribosylaminoimidazole-succinocarboxamide synthase
MADAIKKISSGKVREIYDAGENRLLIVTTDRISAFDVIMPTPITGKGIILNKLSAFWFDYLKDIMPGHIISVDEKSFPAPFDTDPSVRGRGMLVKKLKMLPFECIVRGYITGSAWSSYQKDGTVNGTALPKDLRESQKFPFPLFTPSTKAETGHDENVSFRYMEDKLGSELAHRIVDCSLKLYNKASAYALSKGLIIADTKFEFGLDEKGVLTLGDEVLTPDSSRFWSLDGYHIGKPQKSYDKQYLRDWLKESKLDGVTPAPELPESVVRATYEKYAECFRLLTGKEA